MQWWHSDSVIPPVQKLLRNTAFWDVSLGRGTPKSSKLWQLRQKWVSVHGEAKGFWGIPSRTNLFGKTPWKSVRQSKSGLWFGTLFLFPYIENSHPKMTFICFRMVAPTNQKIVSILLGYVADLGKKRVRAGHCNQAEAWFCWAGEVLL